MRGLGSTAGRRPPLPGGVAASEIFCGHLGLARRKPGEEAVLGGQHQRTVHAESSPAPAQPCSDRVPGAGNVGRGYMPGSSRDRPRWRGRWRSSPMRSRASMASSAGTAGPSTRRDRPRPARCPPATSTNTSRQPICFEPRRRHDGAHRAVVDQHDAAIERADILVGRLHQLAAGRVDGAGQMARRVVRSDRARRTHRPCG